METTRASLLARIRDPQDSQAWSEFDSIYRPIVYRFARSRGLPRAQADEVVQAVMARVARRIGGFAYDPGKGRFRGWLRTLVEHEISDLYARPEMPVAPSGALRALATEETPEAVFDRIWRQEHVRRCLELIRQEVEASTYRAFHLHVIDEMPVEEVCRAMGMTENQLYKIKWRVSRKLAERFRDHPDLW